MVVSKGCRCTSSRVHERDTAQAIRNEFISRPPAGVTQGDEPSHLGLGPFHNPLHLNKRKPPNLQRHHQIELHYLKQPPENKQAARYD